MIQAHPLPEANALDIQRNERSACALAGASGQLLKRVTSGIDRTAWKAAASAGVGARKVSRLVDSSGNFRVAAIRIPPSHLVRSRYGSFFNPLSNRVAACARTKHHPARPE